MAVKNPPLQNITPEESIHGFRLERARPIPELHATAYLFSHEKTDARLLHLFNDDADNLFSIAFRTPVSDSTGVPHILEHSVLCGSKRFPVKDPFQEMLKGSLQTFLNALTYPDKTVYPVSSQVERDYYNLVDVYCDAVFNPILSENTFYQEGWHFDVEDVAKTAGIKGIVYNEMKGVFSDFSSHVDRKTLSALFPDTGYAFESGGEPEHITDLSYEQFRDFHKQYYHPSNSFIFLYGNLPSEKTLGFLQENYLADFDALQIESNIKRQVLWDTPRSISIEAPAPAEDNGTATVVVAWIFGESTDPVSTLSGSILSHYLLGTESSPLKRALIDSGLGEDLDDFSGFEGDLAQTVFAVGLRKTLPDRADAIRKLVFDTLRKEIEQGMNDELLEGAIRQIEFHLREVTSGHFPYSLRLADRCYRSWIYGGDPLAHLAFDQPLSFIKDQRTANGQTFFKDVLRRSLLDNAHHVLSTITASSEMGKRLEQQTVRHAENLTASFGPNENRHYHELTMSLMEQQKTPPSPEALATLPKLQKSDLPRHGQDVPTEMSFLGESPLYAHPIFTSGIAYLDIGFDLRAVPPDLIPYLPVYTELLTRCGTRTSTYEQMATRAALATGGIDSSVSCKTLVGTTDDLFFKAFFFGKALVARVPEMLSIFRDLFLEGDLQNEKQIKDILFEERNGLNSSIISAGHSFAITHASAQLSKSRSIEEQLGGIFQLRFLDKIVRSDDLAETIEAISKLHRIAINCKTCVLSLTADEPAGLIPALESFVNELPEAPLETHAYETAALSGDSTTKGIEINSAVNFVARTWRLPPADPRRSGRLFLMARNLSTGYLWDKVRVEGGAYGGMSAMSVAHPIFACGSYRDPNLYQTLKHFETALAEIATGIPTEKIDQSIIGTIGRIDAPRSPHAKGFGETIDLLVGYTREFRRQLRDSVLEATPQDIAQAAQEILGTEDSRTVVLGSATAFDTAAREGLAMTREQLIE